MSSQVGRGVSRPAAVFETRRFRQRNVFQDRNREALRRSIAREGNFRVSTHRDEHDKGRDIPIVKLVPRTERSVQKKYSNRIEASLRAVGLIDPLVVFPLGDNFEILDGCLRYQILLEMGVETVPCLIWKEREGFTGNRMVNRLSAAQEMRMLRKSLEELDEKTIANALGMVSIKHRLNDGLLKKLTPLVVKAFEGGKLTLQAVKELRHVTMERQAEILKMMESCEDFGVTFVRGLVLNTPTNMRAKQNGVKPPWNRPNQKKGGLLKKLREAEEQQDFYSGLYRQYTTNLLKLVIFVRRLISNEMVREFMGERHPGALEIFEQIINSTEK